MVGRVQRVLLIGLLTLTVAYPATSVSAAPAPVMTMSLEYQQSERTVQSSRTALRYLPWHGTADLTAWTASYSLWSNP